MTDRRNALSIPRATAERLTAHAKAEIAQATVPPPRLVVMRPVSCLNPTRLEEAMLGGPRSDVDWNNATVTVKVPIHGTAQTSVQEVELPLAQLAAMLAAATWTDVEPNVEAMTNGELSNLLGDENAPKELADRASDEWAKRNPNGV